MRFLLFVIVTCFTLVSKGQVKSSNQLISTGYAKAKLKPDVAVFEFTIIKENTLEPEALKLLNLGANKLTTILLTLGFNKTQINISGYTLFATENESGRKLFRATNTLRVQFRLDNKTIDQVYRVIEKEKISDININFETKVSDSLEKATRARLTLLAIADAKNSAENISKGLDMKLGKVVQVQKYGEGSLESGKMEMIKFTPPMKVTDEILKTSFSDFEVDDVELEEQITIIFEIGS
jgi:uncharacterized protein